MPGSPRASSRDLAGGAAAGAIGWMRRLSAHPAIAGALAAAEISGSWARKVCAWTGLLPEGCREDADRILPGAAAGGAGLRDLGGLAEEIRRRTARPGADDDGSDDRGVRLGRTFRGAGRLAGDLTPACAAVLAAVLEALGKRAGPEDLRSKDQRQHDALEEACRRLVGSGCLPGRAGQPTQIMLHMDLDQLRGLPGGPAGLAAWLRTGLLNGPAASISLPLDTGPCTATARRPRPPPPPPPQQQQQQQQQQRKSAGSEPTAVIGSDRLRDLTIPQVIFIR